MDQGERCTSFSFCIITFTPRGGRLGVMCPLSCLQFPFSQLLVWISFSENQLPLIWYSVLFHILLLTIENLWSTFFFLNNFLTFSHVVSCSNAFVWLVIGSWVRLTPLLYVVSSSKCAQKTVMGVNGFSLPFSYSHSGEREGFNSAVVSPLRWATVTSRWQIR